MNVRFRFFLGCCLLAWPVCAGPAAAASEYSIHTGQFAGLPLAGYGAEMSPYLTAPSLGQPIGDLADLEQKLTALAPQHVRIFVMTDWWRPGNEKVRDSFIRTCRLAQTVGASINVTLWHGWDQDPAGSSKRMTELLEDLIHRQSLSAVRYVTLQNEVNGTHLTMERYNAFYRSFDRDLRARGLRSQIQIIGGDLLRTKEEAWFQNLATNLAEVCDGYSVHMYWDYSQAAAYIPARLGEIAAIQQELPAQGRRPLYITEFGVRGKDWQVRGNEPGVYDDGRPVAQSGTYALQIGWLMTEATRRGYLATVQWEAYDVAYLRNRMHYGLLGEAKEGWPLRPSYQVLRLFTHTIAPGWRPLQVDGDSAEVALAAVQGPKGELTIMALNHSDSAQTTSLRGVPSPVTFHRLLWTAADKDLLSDSGEVACGSKPFELTLPPKSLTALTAGSERWKALRLPVENR